MTSYTSCVWPQVGDEFSTPLFVAAFVRFTFSDHRAVSHKLVAVLVRVGFREKSGVYL